MRLRYRERRKVRMHAAPAVGTVVVRRDKIRQILAPLEAVSIRLRLLHSTSGIHRPPQITRSQRFLEFLV